MSDLKYDPEFPFVVTDIGGRVIGRAVNEFVANQLHKAMDKYGQVIDTTPKPKIPEDAEYIIWRGDRNSILEFAEKTQGYWAWSGLEISEIGLIECVGDAEVTVLVRKEES